MVDAVALDGVAKRAHDVLLADHLVEGLGAVAAVERGLGHPVASLTTAPERAEYAARRDVPLCDESRRDGLAAGADRLDRGRCDSALARLQPRLRPVRHLLRARLGRRDRRRRRPRLLGAALPDPAPARDARGGPALATRRRGRARRDGGRVPVAVRGRLPRLPPRRRVVQPRGRRARGGDHDHAPAAARLRRPRLRRHPLPRASALRAARRDASPSRRRPGARAARRRRAAAPRGVAVLGRLPALSRLRRPRSPPRAPRPDLSLPARPRRPHARRARRLGPGRVGAVRPRLRRRRAALPDRDAGHRRGAGPRHGPRRARDRRAAAPRRGPARAGPPRCCGWHRPMRRAATRPRA